MKKEQAAGSTDGGGALLVPGYQQFGGRQAEAGALRNVLAHSGVVAPHTGEPFTDALLFGLGGGIGLGYFVYASGDFTSLFLATRITTGPTGFVEAMCARLGAKAEMQSATTTPAAEKKLKQALAEGSPVIVWVDPRRLPYHGPHGAYHTLVVFGFDESRNEVYIADQYDKSLTLTPDDLTAARKGEGVIKFRSLVVTPPATNKVDAKRAVQQGLRDCCAQMREGFGPPNFKSNFGLMALKKWADLLTEPKDKRGWPKFFPRGPRLYNALLSAYDQIENRGNGGSAFRELYADFLVEAGEILKQPKLNAVADQFRDSARLWSALSAALLPDSVPPFKETKQLATKKRTLFEKKGAAARDETQAINARLAEIKSQVEKAFPMSEAEVQDLLADLRQRVLAIHAVEEKAVEALQALVR
jgi:hypothetical protein